MWRTAANDGEQTSLKINGLAQFLGTCMFAGIRAQPKIGLPLGLPLEALDRPVWK
jgi:hypothetical protein